MKPSLPVLMIHLRLLDPLVFRPPVLEPNLDLCLRQLQGLCQLEPPWPGYVLVALVLELQAEGLVGGESGALPALAGGMYHSIPRLIHEQNGVLGRVNRVFGARVDALTCGVYPVTNAPKGANLIDMGNPIRDAVRTAMETPYAPPGDAPINLLVFGGSQGASVFANLIPAALAALPVEFRDRLRITQQVRPVEIAAVSAVYKTAGVQAELAEFFDDMPRRIAAAQLVICRSGASTVSELTAIGRPSILVPYHSAMDDHQTANAKPLAEAGAAVLAQEAGLTGEGLAEHIRAILEDPSKAAAMAANARQLGRPDAARELGDLVERLAG